MRRTRQRRRQQRPDVTAGRVDLGLGEEQRPAQIGAVQPGAPQVGAGEVGAIRRSAPVRSAPIRRAPRRLARLRRAPRRSPPMRSAPVKSRSGEISPRASWLASRSSGVTSRRICATSRAASSAGLPPASRVSSRRAAARRACSGRAASSEPRFGQVPEQFVQRAHDRERGEHARLDRGRLPPVPAAERALADVLPGPEAVVAGAAGESPRPQLARGWSSGSPASRCGHGWPGGLSMAKSADAEKPGATQHSAAHRAQSAASAGRSIQCPGRQRGQPLGRVPHRQRARRIDY